MNRISRYMIATLALFSISFAAHTAPESSVRYVEVTGHGLVNETPDIALLSLAFSQRDKQARLAKATVDRQVNDLLTLCQQLGIDAKDIHAARLNIHPEYDHKNNRQLIGYRVSRDVQVRLHDLLSYPKLLEGAVDIGATHTGQLRLDFSHRKELENKALQAAFYDARQQAKILAKASNDKLGKALLINSSSGYRPEPNVRMVLMSDSNAEKSYQTGEMSLSRHVQVRFSLQ